MTSKQRAYLKGTCHDHGSNSGRSVNPALHRSLPKSVNEALDAREPIKIHVLKNCVDDGKILAADPGRAYPLAGGTGDRKNDRFI